VLVTCSPVMLVASVSLLADTLVALDCYCLLSLTSLTSLLDPDL
jgi:hypothetical protein